MIVGGGYDLLQIVQLFIFLQKTKGKRHKSKRHKSKRHKSKRQKAKGIKTKDNHRYSNNKRIKLDRRITHLFWVDVCVPTFFLWDIVYDLNNKMLWEIGSSALLSRDFADHTAPHDDIQCII